MTILLQSIYMSPSIKQLHSINQNPTMTTTRDHILQILQEHKNHFVKKYKITKLGLFGSFARNEATGESDIDICFETVNPEPFVIVHFKTELEKIFQQPIDLLQPHPYLRPAFLKRLEQEIIYV